MTLYRFASNQFRRGWGLSLCLIAPWAGAESMSIQSNNLILRNAVIQSLNRGSVKAEGHFINNRIDGGEYNSIGVSATGSSVSVGNSQMNGSRQASAGSSISAMNVTAQNTGSTSAIGVFQGNSLAGNHNSMTVQASGTSIVLSNVKR